eukprot:TRINITY_DN16392_c0_g1_i1.p1 TRINITY_DN16392_c0_g1~~TRINITY_DN16392_c0_g1_i1.p1  ORF type:complete len:647 (+),score=76.86 TRINITY_DN16392_c0_g1_i1:92-2032(+)
MDADHTLVNIFQVLATPKSKARMSTGNIRIPDTVSYLHGSLRCWYYYEPRASTGVVVKDKRDCTPSKIEAAFIKGATKSQRVPVATFLHKSSDLLEDPSESSPTVVEFLDVVGLRDFLHQRENKPDGILQKFVSARDYNNVVQIFWTPYLNRVMKKQNINKLSDHKIGLYDRCVTHEGRSHHAKEVICSQHIVDELSEACRTISKHYYEADHRLVTRLVLYFKYNTKQQLVLLHPSAVVTTRSRQSVAKASSPLIDKRMMINLNPAYKDGTKKSSVHAQRDSVLFQTPSGDFLSPSDYFDENSELNKTIKPLAATWSSTSHRPSSRSSRNRLPLDRALALMSRGSSDCFNKTVQSRILGSTSGEADSPTGTLKFTRGGGGGMYLPARKKALHRPRTAEIIRNASADQKLFEDSSHGAEITFYQSSVDVKGDKPLRRADEVNFWSNFTSDIIEKENQIRRRHTNTTCAIEDVMYRCYSRSNFGNCDTLVMRLPEDLYSELGESFDSVMATLHFEEVDKDQSTEQFMSAPCDPDEDRMNSKVWITRNTGNTYRIRSHINDLLRKVKASEDYNLMVFFESIQKTISGALQTSLTQKQTDQPIRKKSVVLAGTFTTSKLRVLDLLLARKIADLSESVGDDPPDLRIDCDI